MIKLLITTLLILSTSIYTYTIHDTDGNAVSLSAFQGKKILLVNIATGSARRSQLAELEQLHQMYADSLVVIAFPSNSFNHEPRNNAEIKQFCVDSFHTTFIIAEKAPVTGSGRQPVYQWLADSTSNSVTSATMVGDFEKILIAEDGSLVGLFHPIVNPLDSSLQDAIRANYLP